MSKPVKAEISSDGKAVDLDFPYSPQRVELVKEISSWRFVSRSRKDKRKVWRVDLDLPTMRRLREKFGDELELKDKLRAWGHREVEDERNLVDLSTADDAELVNVPKPLLEGAKRPDGRYFELRPYQRADIAFMAQGSFINANQPGSGKTSEHICAVMENELTWGQNLVFAPVTSLEVVWQYEIEQLYAAAGLEPPTVFTGDTPNARKRALREAKEYAEDGLAFWLVLNPHMARFKKELNKKGKKALKENKDITDEHFDEIFVCPELTEIDFDSINVDEFHLCGLSETSTQTAEGLNRLVEITEPDMRGCMSGTPMGGKPIKLWGALHFVEPLKFTSKWNWARQWLEIRVSDHNGKPTREIEGIQIGRELEFFDHLKRWMIRRTKDEILPQLPPKLQIPVWCKMTPKQEAQYRTFELEAELRLAGAEEEGRLTAPNILAEYMRLKQFASAYCDVRKSALEDKNGMPKIEVNPTDDSGKYEQLVEKLEEENVIVKDGEEPKCAIIFSQFNGVVHGGVMKVLERHGVPAVTLTGATKGKDRKAVKIAFQEQDVSFLDDYERHTAVMKELIKIGPPRVLVMNTAAGGTTLTLSQADSVHILDETWNPDDQEQAEDRAHRGDEKTEAKDKVPIYYYRTRGSIEEYIMQITEGKDWNNKSILNLRKRMRELAAAEQGETSDDAQ